MKTAVRIGLWAAVCAAGTAAGTWGILAARRGTSAATDARTRSMANVADLVKLFEGPAGHGRPWPAYDGKRFVLWLVAANRIDRRDPRELEILFSPGDPARSLEKAGGPPAYERVTLDALKSVDADVSRLTSYAGPRFRREPRPRADSDPTPGVAMFADVSFPDGAIVGFSAGHVRWMTREELGIPAGRPITVGDDSPSELLRRLSDK